MKINLASTRLAFFLIAILFFFIVLSALIPQRELAQDQVLDWQEFLGSGYAVIEKLGLDRIYFSPPFFIVLALLAVNLIAGNVRRFALIYRMEKTIVKARHLGSVVFHLSLLVIIAGIILNYLFKFEGVFALTEGQEAADTEQEYFRIFAGPLYPMDYGRFRIRLDKVHDSYQVEGRGTEAADISLQPRPDEPPLTATVLINEPLEWQNLEFHFGMVTGYSPEVLVTDTAGQQVLRGFVRLSTRKVEGQTVYSDFVLLPQEDMKINVEVRPREEMAGMVDFFVVVERGHNPVYEATLTLADTARFAGLELTIPRLRRWCYIDVVKSPFLNLVFIGFWTALGGMVVGFVPRLLMRRKKQQ